MSRLPCACRVRFFFLPRESFPTDLDLSSLRVAPSRDVLRPYHPLFRPLSVCVCVSALILFFLLLVSSPYRAISPSAHCSRRLLRCQGMKEGRKDVSSEMSFTLRFFFSLLPLRSSFNGHLSFWLTFGNVRRASRSVLLSLVDRSALRKELCLSRRRSDTPCNHTTYDVVRSHTTGRNSFTDIFVVLSHTLRFRMAVHMGV